MSDRFNLEKILYNIGRREVDIDENKKKILINELTANAAVKESKRKKERVGVRFSFSGFAIAASLAVLLVAVYLLGQSNGDKGNVPIDKTKAELYSFNGFVQKGPFVSGSNITIQGLDEDLNPTGQVYKVVTRSDFGDYEFTQELESPYIEIFAEGYYYNEVKGRLSSSPITLTAITNVSDRTTVNINILTTLAGNRIKYLVKEKGMDFKSAQEKAFSEVLRVFGLSEVSISDFEELDITKPDTEDALLIAVSAIMQGDQSVAELSELTSKISLDLETDGKLNERKYQSKLIENSKKLEITTIRDNLTRRYEDLGLEIKVPPFEQFIKKLVDFNVLGTSPYDGESDVPVETDVIVTFSKEIDPASLDEGSVLLLDSLDNRVQGEWMVAGDLRSITFRPASSLERSPYGDSKPVRYVIFVSKTIKSIDGESLSKNYKARFTTETSTLVPTPDITVVPEVSPNPNITDGKIAYVHNGGVYVVNSQKAKLVSKGITVDYNANLSWSNDGNRIVFPVHNVYDDSSGRESIEIWQYVDSSDLTEQLMRIDNLAISDPGMGITLLYSPDDKHLLVGLPTRIYVYTFSNKPLDLITILKLDDNSAISYSGVSWLDSKTVLINFPDSTPLESIGIKESGIYKFDTNSTNIAELLVGAYASAFSVSNDSKRVAYFDYWEKTLKVINLNDRTDTVLDYSEDLYPSPYQLAWSDDDSFLMVRRNGTPSQRVSFYDVNDNYKLVREYPKEAAGDMLSGCRITGSGWMNANNVWISACERVYLANISSNSMVEIMSDVRNIAWGE